LPLLTPELSEGRELDRPANFLRRGFRPGEGEYACEHVSCIRHQILVSHQVGRDIGLLQPACHMPAPAEQSLAQLVRLAEAVPAEGRLAIAHEDDGLVE